jgi:hypothetical protein
MLRRLPFRLLLAVLPAALGVAPAGRAAAPGPVSFNRDIRPILSENCFQCHGQDLAHREGKLRLDERESAVRDRGSYAAIVPGKPEDSDMILRLLSTDEEERMPPAKSHKQVTPGQIALLKQWIAEGAVYQGHWAFQPPVRPEVPPAKARGESAHPVDRLVRARLQREGLEASPPAAPGVWLRRVSFDLTGLPPTPAELDAFAADAARRGDAAYEAAVDRLLASPHFGERQAIDWLDAARYADTHGFNNDSARSMWRWRDWVIDAFNANLPYDRFITEQLAGDLLPRPTLEQRIATGWGRNHVINSEGGIIDEEYRVEYVADRVRTFSTAWLGLTFECARCHDHKFDPITQRDYYRLFSFFNNVPEHGEDGRVANAVPMIPAPTREQQATLARQETELASLSSALATARSRWTWSKDQTAKIDALAAAATTTTAPEKFASLDSDISPPEPAAKSAAPGEAAPAAKPADPAPAKPAFIPSAKLDFTQRGGVTLSFWLKPAADNPGDVALFSAINYAGSSADAAFGRGRELRLIDGELELRLSDRYPAYAVIVRTQGANVKAEEWRHVTVSYAGGKKAADVRFFLDGEELPAVALYDDLANESARRDFIVGRDNRPGSARWQGALEGGRAYTRALPAELVRATFQAQGLPRALAALTAGAAGDRERAWLREALLASEPATRDAWARYSTAFEGSLAFRRTLPTVMVMQELPEPRPAFVLLRGNYDAHGEPVTAAVPENLLGSWPAGAPRNRLGLAQWLTQPQHPLTARVVVNRFWAQLFGTGLVKTVEDFGSQGEWPSHPELLDWLARDFIDGGWNVKALFKSLVLSRTYRQSSAVSPELLARDPENRLLARGPRVRLPAELIRDQALAISGLLTPRLGGPSVYPSQPEKLYTGIVVDAAYPGTKWGVSSEPDLYRRSLYTFWKRTVPHPVMITFDSPDREFCTVRRSRTNTPLQALTLLNEPAFVEASRRLATRMLRDGGGDDATRVAFAFQAATGRKPRAAETQVLVTSLTRLRTDYAAHPDEAEALLKIGATAVDATIAPGELAAATAVASMILNLDETVTKN